MTVPARKPLECLRPFESHVRQLMARTIGGPNVVQLVYYQEHETAMGVLGFRQQQVFVGVPIVTTWGRAYFYFWQHLQARKAGRRYVPRITKYAYRLQEGPDRGADRALMRWEYAPDSAGDAAPFHVQLASKIMLATSEELDLNRLHLPTGPVFLEDVVRFLIRDLGVAPRCGDEWTSVLAASRRQFSRTFPDIWQ